jgi:RimJ/RimL family protein N-acetyltransferase
MPAPARRPVPVTLAGRYVTLVPYDDAHAEPLWAAQEDGVWEYFAYGPFPSAAAYRDFMAGLAASGDPLFLTVLVAGEPRGVVSYLRMDPPNGVVEIGHIWYAPAIQRSRATTETAYLLARHAFDDLGHRRLEWKCHARNARSRAAAERFGFTYEGTFRQHMIVKGGNRDTAWFSLLDGEWPHVKKAFEAWLDPANFDGDGRQRSALNAASASTNAWSGSSRS